MKKLLFLLILVLVLAGCSSVEYKAYVQADKMTYKAISAEYKSFVENSKLDKEQKQRRLRLLDTWKKRIDGAQESLK